MKKRIFSKWIGLLLFSLVLLSSSNGEAKKKADLVGRETLNFGLPSTQDRVIHYGDEYYGRHPLILTFFPAAFTPV